MYIGICKYRGNIIVTYKYMLSMKMSDSKWYAYSALESAAVQCIPLEHAILAGVISNSLREREKNGKIKKCLDYCN